jgi:YVTN family beta-propeller protein
VVVASIVAAIVGSVLLVMHRSSRVHVRTVPAVAPALPRGGNVVAAIRIGRGLLPVRGGGPLAVGEGAVWATSGTQSALMRIDPARNAVVAKIKVHTPEAVAAGDGAVWLSNPSEDTVWRIDPAANRVTATIHVGPQPEGIAVAPGAVWVANAGRPSLTRIDPDTNRVVATIRVGMKRDCCAEHTYVTASPRAVWMAVPYANSIVHVDPETNRVVATARLGYSPCGFLAADDDVVWSGGGFCDDVVARIGSRTNSLTARVSEPAPVGLVVALGSVWTATGGGNVDRIDRQSGRLAARLHIVGMPLRLGAGFGSIWVNDDSGRVLRIEPQG